MKPYRVATLFTLLIALTSSSSIKGALTMSTTVFNENQIRSNESSQSVQNHQHKSNIEQTGRIRRLIPYMALYIPKPNRGYLPPSDAHSYKQMSHQKPYLLNDPATISTNYNNMPRHEFIVNGGVIGGRPLFESSEPQLPTNIYVEHKNHNNHHIINHNPIYENLINNVTELHAIVLSSHSQQLVNNNQYVTPALDLVAPQSQYQQINNKHYNLRAEADLQQSSHQGNGDSSYITPFLPSNQVPGPFRPILHLQHTALGPVKATRLATIKQQPHPKQSSHLLSAENVILRQTPVMPTFKTQSIHSQYPIDVAQQTEKPIYYRPENSQQSYLQHGHYQHEAQSQSQPQHFQLISTTEQPINNNIEEPIHVISVPLKSLNTNQRPINSNDNIQRHQSQYQRQQQQQSPQIPANLNRYKVIKAQPVHTNINYNLDPDDGYDHVLLPYDSYYAKSQKGQAEQAFSAISTNYPIPSSNIKFAPIKPISVESITNNDEHDDAILDSYDSATLSTSDKVNDNNRHQTLNSEDSYKTELNSITNFNTESIKYKDFVPVTIETPIQGVKKGQNYPNDNVEHATIPLSQTPSVDVSYDLDEAGPVHTSEFRPSAAPGPQSGRSGTDYPTYSKIPATTFNCSEQRYKGFFGDPDTGCQVWHYCDLNGGQASFLCPNGTVFNQVLLTCDWWFNVKCSTTAQLYVLNERLYKYILPLNPKFPEDYSGPLVDKYLAIKFQEMEEKMLREKNRVESNNEDDKHGANGEDGAENENRNTNEMKIETNINNGDKSIELMTLATADEKTEKYVANNNAVQLDDDGQSHNIDNAMQQPSTAFEQSNAQNIEYSTHQSHQSHQLIPDSIIITSDPKQNRIRNDHRNYYQTTTYAASLPPPPKIYVESEHAEVVEISSDGTSGHLTPGRSK